MTKIKIWDMGTNHLHSVILTGIKELTKVKVKSRVEPTHILSIHLFRHITINGWVYVLYALPNLSIKVRHLIRRIAYIPC